MKFEKKISIIIYSIIMTILLTLNYKGIYYGNISLDNLFGCNIAFVIITVILLYFLLLKIKNKALEKPKMILSVLFSFFMVFGNSYNTLGSWNLVFGNYLMFLLSIILLIIYYFIFKRLFILLDNFINNLKINDFKFKNKKLQKILDFIENKPFISSFIIIFIFWLIYIIAFYPIILSPDPSFQIKQFFNVHTKYADWVIQLDSGVNLTNHHPVIHTLLLGSCIKTGRLIVSDNFGLFIYSFIQIIVLISTLAFTIKYMKKLNIPAKVRMICLSIYALVPMYPLYAMSGVKDTLYTCFMILFVIVLYDIIVFYKDKKLSIKYAIYIFVLILLVALFRNNGLYVIVLTFPFILFYSKANLKRLLIVFIAFLIFFMTYSKVILPSFSIPNGSIREVLSIPFQQTARYVKYHSSELSSEDIKAIDTVLGYDTLVERYKPEISDPVKNEFNKYTTNEELKKYFGVWFKGLLKHPETYIEATMNNVYGYFYPVDINWYIYYKYDTRITEDNLVDYHYNDLDGVRKVLSTYGQVFPIIPLVGLISNIGFNTWLLFIMCAYWFTKDKKKYIIVLVPLLVTVLICVASPVNTYFRYTMPYVFAMPLLISLFLNEVSGGKKDVRKKKKNSSINTML